MLIQRMDFISVCAHVIYYVSLMASKEDAYCIYKELALESKRRSPAGSYTALKI